MTRLVRLILIAAIICTPWMVTAIGWRSSYVMQLASLLPILMIATLSETVIAGFGGQISVGQGGFMAVGAYVAALLVGSAGWPWLPAVVIAIVASAGTAGLIGIPALRLRGPYFVMASLAFGGIAYVVATNWIEVTGGPSGLRNLDPPTFEALGIDPDFGMYYLLWATCLIVTSLVAWFRGTLLGRSLMAVRDDEIAAASIGIHVTLVKSLSFMLSGGIAGLSGALLPLFVGLVTPDTFGVNQSLQILTQVLIGGIEFISGAIVGTVLLLVVNELLRGFAEFQLLAFGLIMLGVILFFPQGIVGEISARVRARSEERR